MLNMGFANELIQIRDQVLPPPDYMLIWINLKSIRWLSYYY
ncbi:MAG: hypothetical protein ACI9WC_000675 [Arenicella sp.]|jgi:hypothetical protein